jgi:hypothetical protein
MGKCLQSWRICVNPAMRAGLAEARVFGRNLAIALGIGSGVQAGAGDVVVASGGGFCRARGRVLSAGGCFELDDELCGYPAAVFHVDALVLGPVPDLGGLGTARAGCASAPGWPPTARAAPGCADVRGERAAQCLGVPFAQVDLEVCAVQSEPDRPLGRASV